MPTSTQTRKSRIVTLAIVSVVAVIAIIVAVVAMRNPSMKTSDLDSESSQSSQSSSSSESGVINSDVGVPASGSVIVVDSAGTRVESTAPTDKALDVTFDYTCVYCSYFETMYYDMIRVSTLNGNMTYVARPVSILSGEAIGSDGYLDSRQTKLAILGYYVAEAEPDKFLALNYTVFANYDNISSYSDTMGSELLEAAGVDDKVADAAITASNDSTWQTFVSETTSGIVNDSSRNFQGTPQIMVEGTELDSTVDWLNDQDTFINLLTDKGIVPEQ